MPRCPWDTLVDGPATGPSLWRADISEAPRLHGGRRAGIRVRNRREYRHFECGERLYPAPAARGKAGGISGSVLGQKNGCARLGEFFLSELCRFARAKQKLF